MKASKVLCVGGGGLGCPALQYLAANGVGTLGVVDGDCVDIRVLYGLDRIVKDKSTFWLKG